MKKIISLFSVLLLTLTNLIMAQIPQVEISEPMPERSTYGDCILFMKNGNFVFMNPGFVTLFTPGVKSYTVTTLDSKMNKLNQKALKFKEIEIEQGLRVQCVQLVKAYEMGGKIVLFIKDNGDRKIANRTLLFRVIINPATLEVEKEERLFLIDALGFAGKEPVNLLGNDSPFFYIAKDETSDYYAIIKYSHQSNNAASSNYEVHHYSPEHKEINVAKFDYVNGKYSFGRPLNLMVYADKFVFIVNFVFNSEGKRDKDTKIVFSKLENGKKNFVHQEAGYADDFISKYCELKRNSKYNIIEGLVYVQIKDGTYVDRYQLIFQSIDPEKMELYKPFLAPQEKLDDVVKNKCGEKQGYGSGMLGGYEINKNGNNISYAVKNVYSLSMGKVRSTNPDIIGIEEFDSDGKEINAWAYPHKENDNFQFVTSPKGNYGILLEMESNMDKALDKKFDPIVISKSNTVLLTFKENGEITKDYIFGKDNKEENIFVTQMYYDPVTSKVVGYISSARNKKIVKLFAMSF